MTALNPFTSPRVGERGRSSSGGVSDAPRPVASAGYNFVRWFAAAAAPFFAPKIEEWTDVHVPFVVAAVTAALGALVVVVRRLALNRETGPQPRHAAEDGVTAFANRPAHGARW